VHRTSLHRTSCIWTAVCFCVCGWLWGFPMSHSACVASRPCTSASLSA
jgi:hypothetical protein